MRKIILLTVIICLFSFDAFSSSYENGPFKVSWLRFGESGVYVTLDPAPVGCGGGTQYLSHFKVSSVNESSYKDMVAGLITAYTADLKIAGIWYRGEGVCSNTNILELIMFKYSAK